jgi:hypothetical protein
MSRACTMFITAGSNSSSPGNEEGPVNAAATPARPRSTRLRIPPENLYYSASNSTLDFLANPLYVHGPTKKPKYLKKRLKHLGFHVWKQYKFKWFRKNLISERKDSKKIISTLGIGSWRTMLAFRKTWRKQIFFGRKRNRRLKVSKWKLVGGSGRFYT